MDKLNCGGKNSNENFTSRRKREKSTHPTYQSESRHVQEKRDKGKTTARDQTRWPILLARQNLLIIILTPNYCTKTGPQTRSTRKKKERKEKGLKHGQPNIGAQKRYISEINRKMVYRGALPSPPPPQNGGSAWGLWASGRGPSTIGSSPAGNKKGLN